MSVLLTEPPEPRATRHEIGSTVIETVTAMDGHWLYRCPELYPVNARHWRGPFATEAAALDDYREKTRPIRLTAAEVAACKRHGYHGVVDGREMVLRLDRLSGGTCLTTYELIPETLACPNT